MCHWPFWTRAECRRSGSGSCCAGAGCPSQTCAPSPVPCSPASPGPPHSGSSPESEHHAPLLFPVQTKKWLDSFYYCCLHIISIIKLSSTRIIWQDYWCLHNTWISSEEFTKCGKWLSTKTLIPFNHTSKCCSSSPFCADMWRSLACSELISCCSFWDSDWVSIIFCVSSSFDLEVSYTLIIQHESISINNSQTLENSKH